MCSAPISTIGRILVLLVCVGGAIMGPRTASAGEGLDTVYLVGGGRVRGDVLVHSTTLGVKIILLDGTTAEFQPDQVERLELGANTATPAPSPVVTPSEAKPAQSATEGKGLAESSSPPSEEFDGPTFFLLGFVTTGASLYEYLDGGGTAGETSYPGFAATSGACLGARIGSHVGIGGTAAVTFTYAPEGGIAPFGLIGPCALLFPIDEVRIDAFAGFRGGGSFAYGGIGAGWGTGVSVRVFHEPEGRLSVDLGARFEFGLHIETAGDQDDNGFAFVPTLGSGLLWW